VKVTFLELSRRVASVDEEIRTAVERVVADGPYVLGPEVQAFERAFAAHCGASHAVGVASGTDAITVALLAVGLQPGDEVITTSNSGVPTVAAIEAAGGEPVLVDVEPASRTLDPQQLEEVVGERTRVIVPVHLYGRLADMDAICRFAAARGLRVVEDAAQAVGAESNGKRVGTLADVAAFSFYPTKNLGALGDGGAVVTNDSVVAERAQMLRTYGESERYNSTLPRGRNSRLDPIQAAILSVQLPYLDGWNARRREIAAYYNRELADSGLVLPTPSACGAEVYHLYVVEALDRDAVARRLADAGIQTLVHYPRAVHQQPAYARLANGRLTVSERLCATVLSLPLYPELTDNEVEAVAAAIAVTVGVSR
jgi:dTDP-4-amino-4,6-dideoxygalactose transaminase